MGHDSAPPGTRFRFGMRGRKIVRVEYGWHRGVPHATAYDRRGFGWVGQLVRVSVRPTGRKR